MVTTLGGEFQEDDKESDIKECLGDSVASLHILYKKKDMIDVKKCEITMTVGNG